MSEILIIILEDILSEIPNIARLVVLFVIPTVAILLIGSLLDAKLEREPDEEDHEDEKEE